MTPSPRGSDQWLAVVDSIIRANHRFEWHSYVRSQDMEIWLGPPEYALMQATLREYGWKSEIEHFGPHDYPRLIRNNRPVCEYSFRGRAIRRMFEPGVRVGVTYGVNQDPDPATR